MGCHVAVSVFPFHCGIGTGWAIPTGRIFVTTVATLALFDDLMANPLVVRTPFGGHKRALNAFFNSCTNHWNHPLENYLVCIKKSREPFGPSQNRLKISRNVMPPGSIVNKNFTKKHKFLISWSRLAFLPLIVENKWSGWITQLPTFNQASYMSCKPKMKKPKNGIT